MDALAHEICCGCLSSGRKMTSVQHLMSDQAFYHILAEIPMLMYKDRLLGLCWECRMCITNFVTFKERIKHSCQVLQEYSEQNNQSKPHTLSKLICSSQRSINIILSDTDAWENDLTTLEGDCDEIKKEVANIPNIKEAVEVKDEEVYSDDDRSLIDIRNEKIKFSQIDSKHFSRKHGKIKTKKKKKQENYEKVILTQEEVVKERHLLALREEYVNAMFKCDNCLITFPNKDDMTEHAVNKHAVHSKHICAVCERGFPSQNSLTVHGHRHSHRWRCLMCGHHAHTERAATKHTHKHAHSENYDIAEKAYQIYEGNKTQGAEINGTKSEDQIPCEYCEKTFRWKTSLRKHLETHRIESGHKRRPFCEPCKLSFTTTANLRKHVSTSSKHQIQLKLRKLKDLPLSPDLAQQAKDIESIKSKINSQREQFPCPQCDKKFQWKGNLLRHLKSHAARANGDLVCVPCNRTFSSIATYKQHMKISRKHVSENDFKYMCSDCGKRFSNKIKLRDHIDWDHLKNYTHTCGDCQKVFKSHTSLYLHKQVVHKHYNAEHLCDHCGKSFPNKTKLRSHIIAIHSRESPYKCSACSARFSWHSCLSRHIRRVHGNQHRER